MAGLDESLKYDLQAPVICDACEGHVSVFSYCLDCKGNICDTCKTKHSQNRLQRDHRVLPRTHPEVLKAKKGKRESCRDHPDKECVTYCTRCKVPCCVDCISGSHNQHPFSSIEEAAENKEKELHTFVASLENDVLPYNEKVYSEISQENATCNKEKNEVREEVKEVISELRKKLDAFEKVAMDELDEVTAVSLKDLSKQQSNADDTIKGTRAMINLCKSTLADGSDIKLLRLGHPDAGAFRYAIPRKPRLSLIFNSSKFSFPGFAQSVGTFAVRPQSNRGQTDEMKKNEDKRPLKSESRGMKDKNIHQEGTSVELHFKAKIINSIEKVNATNVIHTKQNHFWIHGAAENSLTQYSENYEEFRKLEIKLGHLALLPSQTFVGTDSSGKCIVKVSWQTGKITRLFSTDPYIPQTFCVNDNGHLVVALAHPFEKPPLKLKIYDVNGSVFQEIENKGDGSPLFQATIHTVAQNGNGDYVVGNKNQLVCVRKSGEYRWTFKAEKRKGHLAHLEPDIQAAVCDSFQNIIIVLYYNNEVLLLNSDGNKIQTLLTEAQGVLNPFSLSLDKYGSLWIGQSNSVKIASYITS